MTPTETLRPEAVAERIMERLWRGSIQTYIHAEIEDGFSDDDFRHMMREEILAVLTSSSPTTPGEE